MKTYLIEHSQNGWEYTGRYVVQCENNCKKESNCILLIDEKIRVDFHEEFDLKECLPIKAVCINDVNDKGRHFIGLTKGKVYDVFDETDKFIRIIDDFHCLSSVHKSRFKLIGD